MSSSSTEAPDPLSALIVDGEEIDKGLIVSALSGLAGLSKNGEVVQLAGFSSLSARQKVLAYLLAYKAAAILGLRPSHHAGSAELARSIGLPEGTVYPTVSQLRADRSISQASDSKSFLAHHQVASAASEVESKADTSATPQKRTARKRYSESRKVSAKPTKASPDIESQSVTQPASSHPGQDRSAIPTAKPKQLSKPSSGFSPSNAVKDMISDGFFSEPKGIGEVRRYLKDIHAREVPVTTLSPIFTRLLRSKALLRSRNASGTYEYVSPSGSGS
jgi:transposase-like protein